MIIQQLLNLFKIKSKSKHSQKESNYCNDCNNEQSAEIGACEATAVTALASDCVYQKADPTDYGNCVQNSAPEIVPRRERSVFLGEKHIGVLVVNLVCFFHSFFTLSSAKAEILHL